MDEIVGLISGKWQEFAPDELAGRISGDPVEIIVRCQPVAAGAASIAGVKQLELSRAGVAELLKGAGLAAFHPVEVVNCSAIRYAVGFLEIELRLPGCGELTADGILAGNDSLRRWVSRLLAAPA